jgi:hypothetical protein
MPAMSIYAPGAAGVARHLSFCRLPDETITVGDKTIHAAVFRMHVFGMSGGRVPTEYTRNLKLFYDPESGVWVGRRLMDQTGYNGKFGDYDAKNFQMRVVKTSEPIAIAPPTWRTSRASAAERLAVSCRLAKPILAASR